MKFKKSKIMLAYYYQMQYFTSMSREFRSYLPSVTCLVLNYLKTLNKTFMSGANLNSEIKKIVKVHYENNKK